MRQALPFLAFLGVLALAGCAVLPKAEPIRSGDRWDVQASATAGAALVKTGADGNETLRIACRRHPTDLMLTAPAIPATVATVTLRVGDEAFTLTPEAGAPVLLATGPLPPALPAALMSGGPIAVVRDGASIPFAAPDARTAAAFAIACRDAR